MTGWVVAFLVVGAWLLIGAKRYPTYYKRHFDNQVTKFPSLYAPGATQRRQELHQETAWAALGLVIFWGWYELGLAFRNTAIHRMTADERRDADYAKAQQIVKDYEAQQKADFERKLHDPRN